MDLFDVVILLGIAFVVYGVFTLLGVPAGLIVAGICLIAFGVMGAREKARRSKPGS